ncbi:YopX protein [Popillia japonica]|uniref:YopX protein n=1 Tax=Popillia japonica TaxID=7064 RepID=A0AAW1HVV9_POPJA
MKAEKIMESLEVAEKLIESAKESVKERQDGNYCYGTILPGETYSYATLKDGGEIYEWKSHEKCGTVASELWDYIDPCEGMTAEDFQEGCREFCIAFMIDQNEGYPDWFNDSAKCAEKMDVRAEGGRIMQDRYLFRGKRIDNGEWIEGFYDEITKGEHLDPIENDSRITTFKKLDNGEIILTGIHSVDPATVGQCTGTKDKNGVLIFEGDLVTVTGYSYTEPEIEESGEIDITPLGFALWDGETCRHKNLSELQELEQQVSQAVKINNQNAIKQINDMQARREAFEVGAETALKIADRLALEEANKTCPCCQGDEPVAEMDDAAIFLDMDGEFVVNTDGDTCGKQIMIGVIVAGTAAISGSIIVTTMIAEKLKLLDELEQDYEDDY